jgi:hypothetical protein
MTEYFEAPAPPKTAILAAAFVLAAGGLYCSLYNFLQGVPESPLVGAGWSAVNLLPWLAAFEICKRVSQDPSGTWAADWRSIALVLTAAALASIGLELAGRPPAGVDAAALGFEAVRRIPGALLVIVLLLVLPRLQRREHPEAGAGQKREADIDRLPLLPRQIDWIKAAGNYLEFRSAGGVTLRRMTMAEAESLLDREGFVRIHRSALVNRDRVVRVTHGKLADEIKLADGTWLKVGGAYRPFARLRLNGADIRAS